MFALTFYPVTVQCTSYQNVVVTYKKYIIASTAILRFECLWKVFYTIGVYCIFIYAVLDYLLK